MALGVLLQVVSPVKRFAAFRANLAFLSGVHDVVPSQVLVPLESFGASVARVRPLVAVAELVPVQVLLSLQAGPADDADESPFDFVVGQMLLEGRFVGICHVTFWAAEESGAVRRRYDADVAQTLPFSTIGGRSYLKTETRMSDDSNEF